MSGYVLRGGLDAKRRLALLSRALWPTTHEFLKRARIAPGMACLDLGCGGGSVSIGMARAVGPSGRVVGIDMDPVVLQAARDAAAAQGVENVEFRQADASEWHEKSAYDLVYSRFLLTHLKNPIELIERMRGAVKPFGSLALEDIDFSGCFCHPASPAFDRYVDLYCEVVKRRGGDPHVGAKLYSLLVRTGFIGTRLYLVQPTHIDQEAKEISLVTLVSIGDAAIAEGLIGESELNAVIRELDDFTKDPRTVIGLPRVFQAWGLRP